MLRDWKSCPIYDYILRDNNDAPDYKSNRQAWLTDRENPRMITNADTNVSMNVAITFSLEYYTYTYPPPATFQTVTRSDPLWAKQEFVSSFFALQGSSPSKRVPLWSALHSVPSTPSIIFWSRICSILERTGARCLEPTSRTWLETLVSLRLYEASKVGRARKRERENARTCGSWILGPMKTTMRKALCCGNSAAETKKRIGEHRFRRRNFPSQSSVRASSSHSLWIPEFRARVVGTQPWAALSGHPRIYRIHHDEFRGIRCLDGFYSVVPSWKRIRS